MGRMNQDRIGRKMNHDDEQELERGRQLAAAILMLEGGFSDDQVESLQRQAREAVKKVRERVMVAFPRAIVEQVPRLAAAASHDPRRLAVMCLSRGGADGYQDVHEAGHADLIHGPLATSDGDSARGLSVFAFEQDFVERARGFVADAGEGLFDATVLLVRFEDGQPLAWGRVEPAEAGAAEIVFEDEPLESLQGVDAASCFLALVS